MTAAFADDSVKPSPATSPSSAVPSASAAPAATAAPSAPAPAAKTCSPLDNLKISGLIRAYSFDRENAVGGNQSATNFLAGIHADYSLGYGLTLGASYYGAYPFGTNGRNPITNGLADQSLPAGSLSAFPETYLKYKGGRFVVTVGNQFINEKWEPASDSRLMPAAYQGISASYNISPQLSVSANRIIRFEPRTASLFGRYTLLTAPILGVGAGSGRLPQESDTSGALSAHLKYVGKYVVATAEDYSFYDIGNLQYLEARGNLNLKGAKPFVAMQYVGEQNTGRSIVGRINAHSYGVQLGANVTPNLLATVAYNGAPTQTAATNPGPLGSPGSLFFAAKAPGSANFGYGSIASPYSSGYGTDPLFTTSLIDSVVETRSTRAFKGQMTFTSDNKRLVFFASRIYFENVGYNPKNTFYETDADVSYFFSPVGKGTYRGLAIRQRYGVSNRPSVANNSFQQARTQLQYSF
ncbi:MAG: hypothetical protein NVS4B5_10450 [Vulcanimicrobiaceae bacterium]